MDKRTKFTLDEEEIPTHWYNIQTDFPEPMSPALHPATGKPVGPADLAPLFPMELIKQEANTTDRWIEIPEEIRDIYRLWRPTTLFRAHRLEKALDTPAKIFYKYEGTSPPGSHKPNTAIAQAWYNKQEGVKRISTETGAGQWGSALSFGCGMLGIEAQVYMVAISYHQKPYRRIMMQTWGGRCVPSPSTETKTGRDMLAKWPDCPGSLGLAISEAVEDCVSRDDSHYALGSVLNHVMLHQTVNGLEAKKLMEKADAYPDIIVGCIGGGSNYAGLYFPFVKDKLDGIKPNLRVINVEPASCPTMTKGPYTYDFGDNVGYTPLLKMYTLGHGFIPPPIHAGGLRYHGMAPEISHLQKLGFVESQAEHQLATFAAGVQFARTEGIISAPEPNHAIKVVIDEALKCKEEGVSRTILLAHSGHGHVDMAAYDAYFAGKLEDYAFSDEELKKSLEALPVVPS